MNRAWLIVRRVLLRLLMIPLALVLLFEEWGWRPLAAALAALARLKLFARLERLIVRLPPYAALAVFVLPSAILLPVKFLGLYFLAKGQALAAGGVLVAAKIVSTALVARIFQLTRPALMQLAWFARAYAWLMPRKEAVFAWIRASWAWRYGRMVKARTKQMARRVWARVGPSVMQSFDRWKVAAIGLIARMRVAWRRLWRRSPRS